MKCSALKRVGRIIANFGISFLTPLIGIDISNAIMENSIPIMITIYQALATAVIFTGLSFFKELKDWAYDTK